MIESKAVWLTVTRNGGQGNIELVMLKQQMLEKQVRQHLWRGNRVRIETFFHRFWLPC